MEANELFNIQSTYSPDLSLPSEAEGTIFLLGSRPALADFVIAVNKMIAEGMDRSSTFYNYKIRIIEKSDSEIETLGFNMICPIANPLCDETEFVTATSDSESILLAVSTLINETERILKVGFREALFLDAFSHPDDFKNAIDKIIVTPRPYDSNGGSFAILGSSTFGMLGGFVAGSVSGVLGILPDDLDFDALESFDGDNQIDRISENETLHSAALESKSSDEHYLRNLSAKERKERFLKIPDKITASFEKQDPDTTRFINEVADNLSPEEMRAILKEIYSHHKGIAQKMTYQITGGASKYELIIKPRGDKQTKYYRDKLWYIMYLKDVKGREIPLVFKNAPAYCIYVMHVIDRYRCKENTRVLDMRKHRDEFIMVYETLFDEERAQIVHYYDELENRISDSNGKKRNGRYNDYIRDIHQTLESKLGTINSMPFKIGANQFLSLLPSKIQIPDALANLKIS